MPLQEIFFFCCFRTGFRPTKGGRLIRLMHRGMRTGQALFSLGIESGILRVRLWKELLATGAQTTWLPLQDFTISSIKLTKNFLDSTIWVSSEKLKQAMSLHQLSFINQVLFTRVK